MFSLKEGKPIAKTLERKPIILSIVDDDNENSVKESDLCCSEHSSNECEHEGPCCDYCPTWDGKPEGMKIYESSDPLVPIPDLSGRFVEYIAGPSGSGKSTIACKIAMQFRKIYPKKLIYILSRTEAKDDPAYVKLRPIQIPIDEELIENPIDLTQEITEEGCLIIFDDCNTIHNDKIRKEVEKIMADGMEIGRKLNCNMIITSHLVIPNEKKFARTVLNELHVLTVFPKSGSSQQIRYALKQYFGLDNTQIDKILKLKSRWVRISKSYPQYVLYDHGAYIL
jgi:hypothetical protein